MALKRTTMAWNIQTFTRTEIIYTAGTNNDYDDQQPVSNDFIQYKQLKSIQRLNEYLQHQLFSVLHL